MTPSSDAPVRWEGATTWWGGAGSMELGLAESLRGRVRLVLDAGFAGTGSGQVFLKRLEAQVATMAASSTTWFHDPARTDVTTVREMGSAWDREPADVHVLVGGGSTLDFGLLAGLSRPQREASALSRGRCGLVLLPHKVDSGSRALTIAIPTTLGTGAEVSGAACVNRGNDKLLVMGRDLRPDVAICDPSATAGLESRQLREAALEVMARLVVPYAAPQQECVHPLAFDLSDDLLVGNLRSLLRLASRLTGSGLLDANERTALAAQSAHSHSGWVHVGRRSFSSPVWFVATELSHALDVSKAHATAILLPVWESAVLNGQVCWGDPIRLRDLARRVAIDATTDPSQDGWMRQLVHELLPAEPGERLCDPSTVEDLTRAVTDSCVRRWGGGLPMLSGVTKKDLEDLISGALTDASSIKVGQACSI
jgi:alcohol dehydrogenase class IV